MIPSVINIASAKPAGDCKRELCFDDGKRLIVDFQPSIRACLGPQRFSQDCIRHGELVWGGYDLYFPVADLSLNGIDKHATIAAAA